MPNQTELIEIVMNPPDLLQRMARYPKELDREMNKTTEAAVMHVWGSVPPYVAKGANVTYVRTGGLGRGLGVSMGGGKAGSPDIKTVKRLGQGKYEGRFGTRLYYAPHVIGTLTQARHIAKRGWWTMKTIKDKAQVGIQRLFDKMAGRMVKFLGG